MKKITLHRPARDAAGGFQDSGAELTVSKQAKPGHISAEEAKALVDSHGAVAIREKATPKGSAGSGAAKAGGGRAATRAKATAGGKSASGSTAGGSTGGGSTGESGGGA